MRRVDKSNNKKSRLLSEILQYVLLIVAVVVVNFVLQRFLITSFNVSGSSMYPTLKNDDRILMYRLATVNRFDIVVIDSPDEAYETDALGNVTKDIFGTPNRKAYIKRIIGMPGDTLAFKDDALWINDTKVDETYLEQSRAAARQKGVYYMADTTLEEILEKAKQLDNTLPAGNTTLIEKNGKKVIPDDYYFVMGDNRLNSKDSEEFGLVHKSLVKGVAILRFWPLDKLQIAPFKS